MLVKLSLTIIVQENRPPLFIYLLNHTRMDRRSTIATLLGRRKANSQNTATALAGLEPYTGPWEQAQAAHLLRRATYCANYESINDAVSNGLENTLALLLADKPLPEAPLNYFFEDDPNVAIGETWIDAPYSTTVNLISYRRRSLVGWTLQQVLTDGISIREKMVLFWHNHFVTEGINDARFMYDYSNLLRTFATGNFRELTKRMTINPLMLRYLNGNQNSADAPNENYARELLELFTLGKGEPAGPGDYTTFTEDDVVAIAKVLTGWQDRGYFDTQGNPVSVVFRPFRHDTSTKQLSNRLGGAQISNGGDQEYATLIDIIFEQAAAATFICRKLYRYFVYYDISEDTEVDVIQPMAQLLVDNDFEIKPVLEALFRSAHFYEEDRRGCMIKNPIDFIITSINQFRIPPMVSLPAQYELGVGIASFGALQLMEYYRPPNVAGWPAYYQEPSYYQLWINSVSLPQRMEYTVGLVNVGYPIAGEQLIIDPLSLVDSLQNPSNPDDLIQELATLLFPLGISAEQAVYLKTVLLPGLPDSVWQEEYLNYSLDPTNETLAAPVRTKLRLLLSVMLTMPEYFLM